MVGQRRVLRQAVAVDRSRVLLARGLRCAVGLFVPLTIGIATGEIADGAAAALGALLVAFAMATTPSAPRLRTLLLASVFVGASAFVGRLTGQIDALTIALVAVWGIGAGLARATGRTAGAVGLVSTFSLIGAAYVPSGLHSALVAAGLAIAGGGLQAALAVIWPERAFGPARSATADTYAALSRFVAAVASGRDAPERSALVTVRDEARTLLDDREGSALGTTPGGEAFRILLVEADRLYAETSALSDLRTALAPVAREAAREGLDATADALSAVSWELRTGQPIDGKQDLRARLGVASTTIARCGAGAGADASARLEAIRGQLRAAVDAAIAWERPAPRFVRPPAGHRRGLLVRELFSALRGNLTLASAAGRHSLRLGAALAVAVAAYRVFDLPRGYWVPVTVLVILRPDFASTFSRGLQRYAGTVFGALVATALNAALNPGPLTLAVLVGVCSAAMFATALVNYAVFTAAITGTIVFLVALGGLDEWSAVLDRLLDTSIGGALALGAYALFPTWEGDRVPVRLAELIEADRAYTIAVLQAWSDPARSAPAALYRRRLTARRARINAEASTHLALAEPSRHRRDATSSLEKLAMLHSITNRALELEIALEDAATPRAHPRLRPLATDLDRALRTLAAAQRTAGTPAPLPPLRAEQASLAAAEGTAALITHATDSLVNSVTSLDHLLAGADRA